MFINQFKRFNLILNSKSPTYEWRRENRHMWRSGIFEGNSGVPCGTVNNLTVVDLDFYKVEGTNKFIERFNNYVESIDTYTVRTGSGGTHLYFIYDADIPTTTNQAHHIDIRSDGAYVVAPDSVVDGKQYTVYRDTSIKKMPEDIKNWLLENIYTISTKIKNKKTEQIDIYVPMINHYNISSDELEKIIRNLPDKYWSNDNHLFLKYTSFCKYFDKQELWDDCNRLHDGYDRDNNMECYWNPSHPTETIIDSILTEEQINYCKYRPTLENRIEPDQKFNKNKLGYDFFQNHSMIVRSDTGTGKTTSFKHLIKSTNQKFISIVSRISLADEQYNIFSDHGIVCKNYRISEDLKNGDSVIITIDSIRKLYGFDFKDYVIFLDEYNSILEYLIMADTLAKNRSIIYKRFINIIGKCKQVIGCDADINDISIKWIRTYRRNVKYIQNTYKHNQNILAYELNNFDHLIDRLKSDESFIVCCDSKTNAELIYKQLDDPTICLIVGGDDKYYKFDDHKRIIFSPKIMYGIDSSMKRNVYCYYKEQTIQPTGYLQQISRCRNINILYYLFDRKKFLYSPMTYSDQVNETYQMNLLGCRYFQEDVDEQLYSVYEETLNKYTFNNYCYRSNKFAHFIDLLMSRGFKVDLNNKFLKVNDKKVGQLKKCLKADKIEQFNILNYPKVHKILKVPDDRINEYMEYYIDPFKLTKHFNMMHMINREPDDIRFDMDRNHDYKVNKIKVDKTKILYLKKLKSFISDNQDFKMITVDRDISPEDRKILFEEYCIIFRNRSVKKTFDRDPDIGYHLIKMYKELFGDEVVDSERVNLSKDKSGKRKKEIKYTFNEEVLNKHAVLYGFRHTTIYTDSLF